jgi:RNA polymerase sigma-70 factor (ECF subfamily)
MGASLSQTSASLLDRLSHGPDPGAWQRLIALYTPLLQSWLRRHALQPADLDDLVQEILSIVVAELPGFRHSGRAGAFRSWLRTITLHCLRRFWRAGRYRPVATGASDFERHLDELADPTSGLSVLWDREHNRHLLGRLLELVEPDFQPATWRAFRRVVLEGATVDAVAAELNISVNAVFIAKSRVLRRLREEAQGLLDC